MVDDYIRREEAITEICDCTCGELKDVCKSQEDCSYYEALKLLPSASVVPAEELKAEIYKLKHQSEQSFGNYDYYVGYISALSTVEGILAVMDREE